MQFTTERLARGYRTWKCGTCRDRKVKCDKLQPFCATCTTRGYICKGYVATPPDAFIHVEPSRNNTRQRSRGNRSNRRQGLVPIPRRAAPPPPGPKLPTWTPDPVWTFRQFFLFHFVGNAPPPPPRPSASSLPGLLCAFLEKPMPPTSMQYRCMQALTESYFLMRTAGPDACQQGMIAYSRAINAVHAAVYRTCDVSEPDILMGIMCLCLYENIIVTAPKSWIKHYLGISRLIERRGPDYYRTGMQRGILLAFRYTIIISAGTIRQPCFLAQPAWTEVIQLSEAESRDAFDSILNIAVEVPGLLHGLDCLNEGALESTEIATLSMILARTMTALQEWRSTFSSDDSFTSNGSTASAIAFHYMVLLLVEDLCYQLQVPWPPFLSPPLPVPLQSPTSQNEPLGLSERAQQKHSLAAAIVHLAQGSISPDTGIYGILRFIMPLHVAHDNILPGSPDQQALHYLMNTVMAGQHGFQMARRFSGQYTSSAESLSTPCQTSEDLQS